MRNNPSYTALLRPTCLLISEKSATYTIKWSYTFIWQVRVFGGLELVRKLGSYSRFACNPLCIRFRSERCSDVGTGGARGVSDPP